MPLFDYVIQYMKKAKKWKMERFAYWDGEIQRVENAGDVFIVAVHVYTCDKSFSFHVVSFMQVRDDKICSLDEYWGDDGAAPQWLLDKQIGTKIF